MPVLSENSENAVIRIPLYLSGFQRHNRQKAFNIKHFRRIRSIPKLPSKIAKQPLTHKTRNAVDRKVSRVRIPNSPPKTQSYQGFCPYDWAFLFANLPLLHMIFGKSSGVPAGLPCVRQSQDIVHYICRGDLGLIIQFTDLAAVASPNRRKYFRQIAGLS